MKKETTTAEEGEKEERRNPSAQKRKTQTLWSLFGIWKTTEREKDKNEKSVEDETRELSLQIIVGLAQTFDLQYID